MSTEHHMPDSGFVLSRLLAEIMRESKTLDRDLLAAEALAQIQRGDYETALFQALRMLMRPSAPTVGVGRGPIIPMEQSEPVRPVAEFPPPERDGRQWLSSPFQPVGPPPDEADDLATQDVPAAPAPRPSVPTFHSRPVTSARPEPVRPAPRPAAAPSPKVSAIREAWKNSLQMRINVESGYRLLGDCTVPDLEHAASQREKAAKHSLARAADLRQLMALMSEHCVEHVRDLPIEVLRPAMHKAAAA